MGSGVSRIDPSDPNLPAGPHTGGVHIVTLTIGPSSTMLYSYVPFQVEFRVRPSGTPSVAPVCTLTHHDSHQDTSRWKYPGPSFFHQRKISLAFWFCSDDFIFCNNKNNPKQFPTKKRILYRHRLRQIQRPTKILVEQQIIWSAL